jgi:hypothetical protein
VHGDLSTRFTLLRGGDAGDALGNDVDWREVRSSLIQRASKGERGGIGGALGKMGLRISGTIALSKLTYLSLHGLNFFRVFDNSCDNFMKFVVELFVARLHRTSLGLDGQDARLQLRKAAVIITSVGRDIKRRIHHINI